VGKVQLKNHAGGAIVSATNAQFNSPYVSKHTRGGYRSVSGRLYWGFGDSAGLGGRNVDGFTDVTQDSANPLLYSFDPATPNVLTREVGSMPNDTSRWMVPADEGGVAYDPSGDRLIVCPLSAFGFYQVTALAGTPEYLSATALRLNGSGDLTAQCVPGRRLQVNINHPVVGLYKLFGRITSSSHAGGSTTINVAWEPSQNVTFQSPVAVFLARTDSAYPPDCAFDMNTGAQSESGKAGHYKESTGFWYTRLAALNFSTRNWTPLDFRAVGPSPSLQAGRSHKNLVFIPAAVTGRGDELHSLSGFSGYGRGAMIYNLSAMTVEFVPVAFDFDGQGVQQGQIAFDGTYCYVLCVYTGKLWRWNPQAKTATVLANPLLDQSGASVILLSPPVDPDMTNCVWNDDLKAIEIYTQKWPDGHNRHLYLLDPLASPLRAVKVGNTDSQGNLLRGMVPGRAASRTVLIGDLSTASGNNPPRVQTFIGGNLAWQALANGQHWWKTTNRGPDTHLNDARPMTLTTTMPSMQWGDAVPEVDAITGLPNGVVYWRLGGDGDYQGNEVNMAFLQEIAGTTVPLQTNMATNAASAALWRNDIHVQPQGGGGTTAHPHILADKDNLSVWQPAAIHGYSRVGYHPAVGYIEDHRGPDSLPIAPENNPWPYPGQAAPTIEVGLKSRLMQVGPQGIISWSRSGGQAGLWVKRVTSGNLPANWRSQVISDYNPTTGRVLIMHSPSSENLTFVYEWDGSSATFSVVTLSATVSWNGTRPLIGGFGTQAGAAWWLEGSEYVIYNNSSGGSQPHFMTRWNRSTTSGTVLRGANGNPLLESALDARVPVHVAFDRAHRTAYWMIPPPGTEAAAHVQGRYPFRLYRSHFGDLMNLVEMPVRDRREPRHWIGGLNVANRCSVVFGEYLYFFGTDGVNVGSWGGATNLRVSRLPLF
jgi:hypothetical protein